MLKASWTVFWPRFENICKFYIEDSAVYQNLLFWNINMLNEWSFSDFSALPRKCQQAVNDFMDTGADEHDDWIKLRILRR